MLFICLILFILFFVKVHIPINNYKYFRSFTRYLNEDDKLRKLILYFRSNIDKLLSPNVKMGLSWAENQHRNGSCSSLQHTFSLLLLFFLEKKRI